MVEVRRCSKPARTGPSIWIRRLKASEKINCTVYSTSLQGLWTHWLGNHSLPCFTPKTECPGCKTGAPLRQKFFLHIGNMDQHEEEFLELPPGAADDFLGYYPEGSNCRGQRLTVTRGKGKKARLAIEIHASHEAIAKSPLPQPKDPFFSLCELWGLDPKNIGFSKDDTLPFPRVAQ